MTSIMSNIVKIVSSKTSYTKIQQWPVTEERSTPIYKSYLNVLVMIG